jgi:DeoR/GlpR family transcriptional regulator of sugar metabolism
VVATLTEEILSNLQTTSFLIASEHQLCRRFGVSRVTVRLALGDLENRGLIFRKHGKGTFAHGNSTRVHRRIAVLIKSRESIRSKLVIEIVRGAFTTISTLGSSLALIGGFLSAWNTNPTPFVWTASVEKILEKIARARRRLEQIQSGCSLPKRKKISTVISGTLH